MSPKKIVYIGNNLSAKTKYTPMLVTLSGLLKKEGYSLVIASNKMNKFLRMTDMILTVLKHRKTADFVLLDTFGASNFYFAVVVAKVAHWCNLKYIPILRGGNLPDRFQNNKKFTEIVFKNSFKNITPSNYLKVELEKHGYSAKVIPNILDIDLYKFKERTSYAPTILYVRAFHQIYNPTMAVKVLKGVKDEYPEAKMCMVGPAKDDSFDETKALSKKYNLEDSITYTGVLPKKDWHKLAEDFDVFINTTTIDNTPVSVMEAMAMGLPVISTNVGGIPYLLNDNVDAFLVENDDHEAMTKAILQILSNSAKTNEVVKNARRKVEKFDWSVVRNDWMALFDESPISQKLNLTDKIYKVSPVFIQNLMISVYGIYWKNRRLGGKFKDYVKEFKERSFYTEDEWQQYQTMELRKLLIHAYSNVPFYRELYSLHGFGIKDFETFEISDLKKLPYLEKEDLRKYGRTSLLAKNRKPGSFYESSGSTGTPTSIYYSKDFHKRWNALYEVRVRNWAGVNFKMSRAMIGGRRIVIAPNANPPYYRYNSAESQSYFSAYHISEKTTQDYINGLKRLNTQYLVGYAMSIYLLAKNVLKLKLKAPVLKAVLTSSEKLTPIMRETIENVFHCKVYDAYSGVEACGLISETNEGELFHSPDSGIMEVIDMEGNEVSPMNTGEVVATGFLNYDQPLIRYRIGDRVKVASATNQGDIHMLKISEIEGRVEDVILGERGQEMVRFHGVFIGIQGIVMSQVIQKQLDHIEIRLVIDGEYNEKSEEIMRSRILSQLGKVQVHFSYVDQIEKTKSGKFKAVISQLTNDK